MVPGRYYRDTTNSSTRRFNHATLVVKFRRILSRLPGVLHP